MAGIDNKKENLKAFSLLTPSKSATVIVKPLLESPGTTATPWATPIKNACEKPMSSAFSLPIPARKSTTPHKIKAAAITEISWKIFFKNI